jgi:DNA repair protein RAD51
MTLDELQSVDGIGEMTAQHLMQAGITNVITLASSSIARLVAIGLTKATALKLLEAARHRCRHVFGFTTGDDIVASFLRREYLTTGTQGLDTILGGRGFETQRPYELYGPDGVGKTNLVHQLICTALLPKEQGGLNSRTLLIDAVGSFSLQYLRTLAPRFGIDPDQAARSVIVAHPPTSDVLLYQCEREVPQIASQMETRLICLNSIATLFLSEYGVYERQLLPERDQRVARVIQALKETARVMNGVLLVINEAEENRTGMGRPWQHWGTYLLHDLYTRLRMAIKSTSEGLRILAVEKALDLSLQDCVLALGPEGFTDYTSPPKRQPPADPDPNKAPLPAEPAKKRKFKAKAAPSSDPFEEEDFP